MSVIVFSKEEICRIGNSILNIDHAREKALLAYDRLSHLLFQNKGAVRYEDEHEAVLHLMNRLFIANQTAYHYQYPDTNEGSKMVIETLEKEDFLKESAPMNKPLLLKELKGLKYNLYANSGNSFISETDMERLDGIIHAVMDEMIRWSE